MARLSNIKNLIFDLGGVIIDLNLPAAYQAFASLSNLSVSEIVKRTNGLMLFTDYEKGLVTSEEFREQIGSLLNIPASADTIDDAWCTMLGNIPIERLELLSSLLPKFRTFALSNTNDIHAERFDSMIGQTIGNKGLLNEYFEKVYFSHEMKMRKPDAEIYQAVLDEQRLVPAETLFIDDNLENINGASTLGIRTLHLQTPQQLITFFNGDQ
ncbi:MAG: hydrolase [Cyclobacteriaceae bacterium]|nr:MAG: hydrolase [Cyclobacteriaceae bacterium]